MDAFGFELWHGEDVDFLVPRRRRNRACLKETPGAAVNESRMLGVNELLRGRCCCGEAGLVENS